MKFLLKFLLLFVFSYNAYSSTAPDLCSNNTEYTKLVEGSLSGGYMEQMSMSATTYNGWGFDIYFPPSGNYGSYATVTNDAIALGTSLYSTTTTVASTASNGDVLTYNSYKITSISKYANLVWRVNFQNISYTCELNPYCDDGGLRLNGLCDRKCSEVGMYTNLVDTDNDWTTPPIEQCSSTSACDNSKQQCISKCGGIEFVKDWTCNESESGLYTDNCQCQDSEGDSIDNIIDTASPDENTEATDSLLTNKLLQSIEDNTLDTNNNLSDIESLLFDMNNRDINSNEKLTDIDNSINDLSSGIDGISSTVSNMNSNIGNKIDTSNESLSNLELGLEETNEHLDAIEQSNQGIFDQLFSYIFNLFDTDTISNALNAINMESKMSTYLSDILSSYANVLGISSSYGSRPSNITVTLFSTTYTLLDFTKLDPYISAIRALFLSMAYITGLILFLKKD